MNKKVEIMYLLLNKNIPLIGGFSEAITGDEQRTFTHLEIDVQACKTACEAVVASCGNSYLVADESQIRALYSSDEQLFFKLENTVLKPLAVPQSAKDGAALRVEIQAHKKLLQDTDWTVTKCLELGIAVSDKYPDIHRQRIQARAQINQKQQQLGT